MTDKQDFASSVKRWDVFEIVLHGPAEGNPFIDQSLTGIFSGKNESVTVEGFYDGDGVYKIRFMPSFAGRYHFVLRASFLDTALSGAFIVEEADENDFRLVFEIKFVKQLFEDYKPIKLMIWRTFTDTNLRAILAM